MFTKIRTFLLMAAAASLLAVAAPAPVATADSSAFSFGSSRSALAGFEGERFFAEVSAVKESTAAPGGVDGRSFGCVAFGLVDRSRVAEACGPLDVNVDPMLDSGRIVGTLESAYGPIDIDLTINGIGETMPFVAPEFSEVEVAMTSGTARNGTVTGTIGALGIGTTDGSSWYGQLVQELAGRVAIP